MKKLSKLFSMASAAAVMLSVIPASSAAGDITYPENTPDLEAFIAEHPDGYIINDDGSVYLYPTNIDLPAFSTGYCVSSQKSYKIDEKDVGLVFQPEEENKGRYVVSLCNSVEDIISFSIPDTGSGNDKCHFHCFTPYIQSYLIDTTEGVRVENLGFAYLQMEDEKQAYVKQCEEAAAADPEKYGACFSHSFITMDELFDGIYVSYVNGKLSDNGNTSPFIMTNYGYDSFQRLIVGEPSADSSMRMQPDTVPSVVYNSTAGASDDLMTRTGEERYYRIYDLPEKDKQEPFCVTDITEHIEYIFHQARDGWSEYIERYDILPDPPPPNQVQNDVNGDGEFNVADLVALNQFLLSGNGNVTVGADINGDGSVDSFDLVFLRRQLIAADPEQKNYTYIKDVTQYGTDAGINAAIFGKSYVFHDFTEMTDTLRPMFRGAVFRDLEKRYADGFFKNNDLLLCLTNNSGGAECKTVQDVVYKLPNGEASSLYVNMKTEESEDQNEYIEIHQVAINKNVLGLGSGISNVVWNTESQRDIDCIGAVSYLNDIMFYDIPDMLVNSYDEFISYMTNDRIELKSDPGSFEVVVRGINSKSDVIERITLDENLFKTKSVYIHPTDNMRCNTFCRADAKGNTIRLHEKYTPDYGDVIYNMLQFYIFDKADLEGVDNIETITHKLLDERYDPGKDKADSWYLGICQYSFNDESSVALYSRYSIGFAPRGGYILKDDIEVQAGFKPFGDDIRQVLRDAGEKEDISGENYSIRYGEDNAEVSFRTSPGGEFVSVEIPYTDYPYYYN